MEEIWKDAIYITKDNKIWDFEGIYQVSNFGNVRSYRANSGGKVSGRMREEPRLLTPTKYKNGYYRVAIKFNNGLKKTVLVHRLVCSTFIEMPRTNAPLQVNHKDENKANNRVDNLEWCTPLENTNHGTRTKRAIENGLKTKSQAGWKEKVSRGNNSHARAVVGVNVETGELLELDSMQSADDHFGIKLAGRSISATIRGKQKTAYGYKWYYKEDYENSK